MPSQFLGTSAWSLKFQIQVQLQSNNLKWVTTLTNSCTHCTKFMDAKITLKIHIKSHIKTTPTCFGTQRNHPQVDARYKHEQLVMFILLRSFYISCLNVMFRPFPRPSSSSLFTPYMVTIRYTMYFFCARSRVHL